MFRQILIATDGSELAGKALNKGLELAQALKARAVVLTVTPPFPLPSYGNLPEAPLIEAYSKAMADNTARILSGAKEAAEKLGVAYKILHDTNASPAESILSTAKSNNCDLIVMASHGYRGVRRLLLGSVATKVVTLSELPVLICR